MVFYLFYGFISVHTEHIFFCDFVNALQKSYASLHGLISLIFSKNFQ